MVASLKKPRRVMLMVKAGQAVDDFLAKLIPLLNKGDIIIDGGNSEHQDTTRRCRELEKKGLFYVGSGVSGGEEGARYGPSLMPGGNAAAWPYIRDIFQVIKGGASKASGAPIHSSHFRCNSYKWSKKLLWRAKRALGKMKI